MSNLIQYTITNNTGNDKEFYYLYESTGSYIEVLGFSTKTFEGDDDYTPYQLTTGIDENDFLNQSTYTPPNGFAYLWNDGTKVKHIKISNIAANGQSLSSFVRQADWVRFLMTEAKNSDGNYVHPSSYLFPQPEQYILRNATIENGYSHLFINQNSPLTSTAVASENPNYLNFNFTGSGDIIIYDTASGDITDPIFDPSADPQGYFPRNIESASIDIKEQFFKEYNGPINDSLGFFNEDIGIYTFGISSTETIKVISNVSITGSTPDSITAADYGTAKYGIDEYGGTGTAPAAITWETASLKLYVNNFPVETSTIYIDDISSPENINLTYSYTPSIGDTLKISLDVTGSQANKTNLNSALLVTDYTLSVSASVPPASDLVPTYFNNSISIIDDCDPFLNNIVGDRPNERLQDVDYSVDALNPINFKQIIRNEAVRATVPESNYTQLGFSIQRYNGSSTTRDNINEYNEFSITDPLNKLLYSGEITNPELVNRGKGPSIGKVPNIELKNAYIAYFNKIIDPYPTLNNKTAYYVKYLIDESGTIFEPSLSDINYDIFIKTFRLYDYDLKSTRANISIQNIDEAKELSKLEKGLSSTFKIGEYPVPILYTQNSSTSYSDNISLSGSKFYNALNVGESFTNFGANIFATQSSFPSPSDRFNPVDLSENNLEYQSQNITLFEPSVGVYTTSSIDDAPILFPLDPYGVPPNTIGGKVGRPTDTFIIQGKFKFSTSTMPGRYSGDGLGDFRARDLYTSGDPVSQWGRVFNMQLKPYQKPSSASDNLSNYVLNSTNFLIDRINLIITQNPGESDEKVYTPLKLDRKPSNYGHQWTLTSSGLNFTPDSQYIEDLIIQKIFGRSSVTSGTNRTEAQVLIGGGWTSKDGVSPIEGIGQTAIKYDWEVEFTKSNIKQGDGFYLKASGEITARNNNDRHGGLSGNNKADDVFIWYGANGENSAGTGRAWSRTFSPNYNNNPGVVNPVDTKPVLTYTITSGLASNSANQNGAAAPFWRRVDNTIDELYMSSSILNQTYAIKDENGDYDKYFVQAKLPYTPGTNTDFPLTVEPDFIEFDPVTDPWSLEVGDEIRFENDENLTYTITSVSGRQAITPPTNVSSELQQDKLKIIVTPPFIDEKGNVREPSDFDFFVVRRYKENKNFIIMDQQKPYGFPVSASSSPGILLPEHRIERFNTNPDAVLKDLIEKNII